MKTNAIMPLLASLKLKGMAASLERIFCEAEKNAAATPDVLAALLDEELRYRQERSLFYRLNKARIPWDLSLATFPFEQQPAIAKHQIMNLADAAFVERGENIVFIGNTGTGKSGLATGLLRQAILAGHRGLFYNAQDLLDDVYASMADRSTSAFIKRLTRIDLLVIDELGYLNLTQEQMNAFFKLMADRYLKNRATIITTNLDYTKWYDLFASKDMVDALLDRLQHRCITIRIDGPSLRTPISDKPNRRKNKK